VRLIQRRRHFRLLRVLPGGNEHLIQRGKVGLHARHDDVRKSCDITARTGLFVVNLEVEVTMTTITISISDDGLRKLREKASYYQVAPEDLVRVSLEDLLDRPTEDFRQAVEYVLNKNSKLYQRLA
jgi:hypothetical protein